MNTPWNLSERETQVMVGMVKHGGTQKLVARELGIAPKTVATLYARACEKIGGATHTISLLEWDRLNRSAVGHVEVCSQCGGAGHIYRRAA